MTPADLSRTVLHAVRRAVDENALRASVPARVRVERARPGGSGDYACAVALQLAGDAGLPALEVARILRERVAAEPGIGRVEITGPGFLSFTLDAPAAGDRAVLDAVREQGSAYGHGDALRGEEVRLRHAPEVRAAVTADAVRRLLAAQGARVEVSSEEGGDLERSRLGRTAEPRETPPDPFATTIRPVPAHATAAELLERLGADATRWGLLRPAPRDRAPLGNELLVQGEANPLFRVRYAYARSRALTRGAAALGFTSAPDAAPAAHGTAESAPHPSPVPYEAPTSCVEPIPYAEPTPYDGSARPLLDLLADHPGVLLTAARHRAPDRVARQLEAVAHAFFDFHGSGSPLPSGDEKPSAAHRSRLALAEAAGTVLAGGLSLLGISAPEHL
ncbi:ArgS-related anticodon-binding protein NrtL [Streptomyces sp. NPDC101178]|uniref:ArgS-related anticodon-binding protein NrtL n=1 Tax=Streptomyces sp. NPDC101178 TaxID=3366124 RepID=UPI0037FE296F